MKQIKIVLATVAIGITAIALVFYDANQRWLDEVKRNGSIEGAEAALDVRALFELWRQSNHD